MLQNGHIGERFAKPRRSKETLEAALTLVAKPRSSSLFFELACSVSLENCIDRAFSETSPP